MAAYQYQTLDRDKREIRLFHLFPGSGDQPITGELTTVSLDKKPRYDALSYVWGCPEPKSSIYVNGDHIIQIGPNLRKALGDLRLQRNGRTLWVDAICINQEDSSERSQQVSIMVDIYRSARKLRAWLDMDVDPTLVPFRAIRKLVNTKGLEDYSLPMKVLLRFGIRRSVTHHCGGDRSLMEAFWKPVLEVFKNDYWTRLWVQQELTVSRKLTFHCRRTTVSGEGLSRFYGCLATDYSAKDPFARHLYLDMPMGFFSNLAKGRYAQSYNRDPSDFSRTLLGLFSNSGELGAVDPRDYVYGCLGLLTKEERDRIQVDYTLTIPRVYAHVFRDWLSRDPEDPLNFLCFWSGVTPDYRLPSWMPAPGKNSVFFEEGQDERYLKSLRPVAEISEDGLVLSVTGFHVDTAQAVIKKGPIEHVPISSWFPDLVDMHQELWPSQSREASKASLVEALTAGSLVKLFLPWSSQDWELPIGTISLYLRNFLDHILTTNNQDLTMIDTRVVENFGRENPNISMTAEGALRHQTFFSTRNAKEFGAVAFSNIDLAPGPGDQVWIIVGCGLPVILRPESPASRRFRYIGPANLPYMKDDSFAATLRGWEGDENFLKNSIKDIHLI